MRAQAKRMALGGVTAALAVVLMFFGTLIPVATFVIPVILCLFLDYLKPMLGVRYAVAWYFTVAILGVFIAPDKEAAAVYAFLGYYPIIKPWLDKKPLAILWKLIMFNIIILAMYWMLMNLFGMEVVREEFAELGKIMTVLMLLLGNLTFILLDFILGKKMKWRRR